MSLKYHRENFVLGYVKHTKHSLQNKWHIVPNVLIPSIYEDVELYVVDKRPDALSNYKQNCIVYTNEGILKH